MIIATFFASALAYLVIGIFVAMPILERLLQYDDLSIIAKSCAFWGGALVWPIGVPFLAVRLFVKTFVRRIFS